MNIMEANTPKKTVRSPDQAALSGRPNITNSSNSSIQAINITMVTKVRTKEEATKERKDTIATLTRTGMTRVSLIIPTTKEDKATLGLKLANAAAMETMALTRSMATKNPTVGSKANGATAAVVTKATEVRALTIITEMAITTTLRLIRQLIPRPIIRRNLHLLLPTVISKLKC